jgi:hypothetical protein
MAGLSAILIGRDHQPLTSVHTVSATILVSPALQPKAARENRG